MHYEIFGVGDVTAFFSIAIGKYEHNRSSSDSLKPKRE